MFGHKRSGKDFAAEIEAHIEIEAERLRAEGVAPGEARAAAERAFGNATRAQERFYDSTHALWRDNLARDLRVSVRMLRKSPSFALAAVLTLAVAIAANLAAFGALNAVLLRPIPGVPNAGGLVAPQPRLGDTSLEFSYPDYVDLQARNRSFTGLAGFAIEQAALESGGNTQSAWLYQVSGNYFDVLGLHPFLGRFFHAADLHGPNSAPEIVLSYGYWRSRFGGDPGVLGSTVELNRHPFEVIGVAPPGFHGTILFFSPAFYLPLVDYAAVEGWNYLGSRGNTEVFMTLGRLRPGVTPAMAVADLNAIGAGLARAYPKTDAAFSFSLKPPGLYGDFIGRPARAFVLALMLLAGLILLAACANLGSLFAARANDRARELAVRLALGASRGRVLRLFFIEAVLLALAGGGLGLAGGWVLLRRLSTWQPLSTLPIHLPFAPDAHVCLAALGLALLSSLLAGAATLRPVLRTDPYQTIKSGAAAEPRRRFNLRDLLLGAQIAVCAVLLTAALVAVRGLAHSQTAALGIQPSGATLISTDLAMAGYRAQDQPAVQKRMLAAVTSVAGVQAAGMADWLPLTLQGWKNQTVYADSATDLRPRNAAADATVLRISPGYLHAAGTRLLAGRDFTWSDGSGAPLVAVVNQQFARQVLGGVSGAVGRFFKLADGKRIEAVGVAENGKYNSLTEAQQPALFLPILQFEASSAWIVARSQVNPPLLAQALRRRLRQLDPGLPVAIQTWTAAMDGNLLPARIAAVALGVLGALSALLAMIGIFGLTAYSVSKHQHEMGIRMALGARRGHVLHAALDHVLRLFGATAVAGLLLGVLGSRVLGAIVYQATPRDPLVLAGVVGVLVALGAAAAWIPARRALRTDPAEILRES